MLIIRGREIILSYFSIYIKEGIEDVNFSISRKQKFIF